MRRACTISEDFLSGVLEVSSLSVNFKKCFILFCMHSNPLIDFKPSGFSNPFPATVYCLTSKAVILFQD